MTLHDFARNVIFTEDKPQRYFRHIAFWLAQVLLWSCWAGTFFCSYKDFIDNILKFNNALVLQIIYTYLIVYRFVPKYLEKERYLKFCIYVFTLTLFAYPLFIAYQFWAAGLFNKSRDEQLLMIWYASNFFIFAGPPSVCAMFLTLKMFKKYFSKMVERNTLVKENANAELRLLKAQIHPHFLFNTLNNIYSFALNKSNDTSGLVLKLKNTIRYMVYDCNVEAVLLEKEINMLDDYIGLEKVRYGDRLNFNMVITGSIHNKTIAPLLLIPFVENAFKHGISKMRGNHLINLSVSVFDNQLEFSIINDRLPEPKTMSSKKGIGLSNVQKRLQLLYPDRHLLVIHSTEKKYEVYLNVELGTMFSIKTKEPPIKDIVYA